MFATLRTLMIGGTARAEEHVRDAFSIELIDQKIREADASLRAAKLTLAGLMQRQRTEERQAETLTGKIADLTARARAALAEGRDDLVEEAARAIAAMENELTVRRETIRRLDRRVLQLRESLDTAHRRTLDLKQGALAARAVRKEQDMQRRLGRHIGSPTAVEEAEELIARVMSRDDPFEQSEILREIDAGLDHRDAADRLAEAGFGAATKTTAADVLIRIKT
jgi:phage shock protein A